MTAGSVRTQRVFWVEPILGEPILADVRDGTSRVVGGRVMEDPVLPAPEADEPAGLPAGVSGDADGPLEKIDELVQPASEPENAVLVDEARVVRWTGPLFALFSLILLPWTVYLGETLPSRQLSPHYDVAWAGFDVILLIGLAGTAFFALRRSRYLAISAAATAALLIVDAWFDVLTTPASQRAESILLAAVVELPLAAVCIWLSLHTEQLQERRITLLLRRRRQAGRPLARPGRVRRRSQHEPARLGHDD